jgi:hypothetical protein
LESCKWETSIPRDPSTPSATMQIHQEQRLTPFSKIRLP